MARKVLQLNATTGLFEVTPQMIEASEVDLTPGGCTKTPPSAAGNIVQRLGFVVEVASVVRVQMDVSMIVKL